MNIKWIGSPNFDGNRKPIDRIVLHWIVGTLAAADAVFQDDLRDTSAHYAIGNNEVHQYVEEKNVAYHAGNYDMNQRSIGIEHEGGPTLPISDATYNTSIELITSICKKYNIPADDFHIIPHRQVKATQCPGTLDMARIIQAVKKSLANVTPPSIPTVITENTPIPVGGDWGSPELQALRSILNDQARDVKNLKQDKTTLEAVNLDLTSANQQQAITIDDLRKQLAQVIIPAPIPVPLPESVIIKQIYSVLYGFGFWWVKLDKIKKIIPK